MSLPKFEVKGSLFESLGSIAADLFDEKDKYTTSAGCREEVAECYEPEKPLKGRTSHQEPRVVSDSCIDFTCHLPEISHLLNLPSHDLYDKQKLKWG